MEGFAQVERYFWLFLAITLTLILLAHLFVNISVKWSDERFRKTFKTKRFKVRIVSGFPNQWCSLYIGKTLFVKPFYNARGDLVDSFYTVVPCKENKRVLREQEYLSAKYPNPWGITLSVGRENVEVLPEAIAATEIAQ